MDWTLEQIEVQSDKAKFKNYKRISELIIFLFFLLVYLFLKHSQIPKLDLQFTKYYRQIDWKKYEPDQNRIIKKQQVPAPLHPSANGDPSYAEWPEIVDTDFLSNDVSALLNQQPERSLDFIPDKHPDQEYRSKISIDQPDISTSLEQQDDYFKESNSNLLPQTYIEPQNIGTSVAVNNVAVNQNNSGNNKIYPRQDQVAISPQKIIADPGVIDIPLITKQKVTNSQNLSVIMDDLLRWMKKHPTEFNRVTKSFLMYEENDLTSRVLFRNKNRAFELYLLYKPKSKEIRICLIEGTESTMLIDSGFKKQSNYLRTGSTVRGSDNAIIAFGTSQYPASEKTTFDFYQLFLSWWEQAKLEK